MKLLKITVFTFMMFHVAGGYAQTAASSDYNGQANGCIGVSADIEPSDQTPGMKYISENDFKNTGQALRAAKVDGITLTTVDLCFLVLNLEIAKANEEKKTPSFKPECEGASETHACNGGGVQPGVAGEGKVYLKNFDKKADIKTVLENVPDGLHIGWGDLQYAFHDITPESIYEQQVANTAKAIDALLSCQETDISKCNITDSEDTKYLNKKNPKTVTAAIDEAVKDGIYLGFGALMKHYVLAPGEDLTTQQKIAGGGGGGGTTIDDEQTASVGDVLPDPLGTGTDAGNETGTQDPVSTSTAAGNVTGTQDPLPDPQTAVGKSTETKGEIP